MMKPSFYGAMLLSVSLTTANAQSIPSKDAQIKATLLAASPELKDGATVLGYDQRGELVVLRQGTNELVCLADDPKEDGFSAACYHKDLEPFMARGRELRKDGKSYREVFDSREAEVKSGKLPMPKTSATLTVFYGSEENYNRITGEATGDFRYVIYIPYATAESTGLPLKPETPGGPWLMDAGTHRAHIMITPPSQH